MIVAFVLVIPYLAQPWRGIVDAGVVVGLLWGLITIVVFAFQPLRPTTFRIRPRCRAIHRSSDLRCLVVLLRRLLRHKTQ